jgi:hypothetical protein
VDRALYALRFLDAANKLRNYSDIPVEVFL